MTKKIKLKRLSPDKIQSITALRVCDNCGFSGDHVYHRHRMESTMGAGTIFVAIKCPKCHTRNSQDEILDSDEFFEELELGPIEVIELINSAFDAEGFPIKIESCAQEVAQCETKGV